MHPLLLEGLSDALGFVGGALLAYWGAWLLGWDLFAPGYGPGTTGALIAVGLGGGLGLQLARRWRRARAQARASTTPPARR